VFLLGLWIAGLPAMGAGQTQAWENPFVPGGKLELGLGTSFTTWTSRFGMRMEDGGLIEENEPLGFDLTDTALKSRLFPGEEALREALGSQGLDLRLGVNRTHTEAGVIRLPLRVALGITDWLTIGATIPLVRQRMGLDQAPSPDSASAGITPTLNDPGAVDAFLIQYKQAVLDAQGIVEATCGAQGESSPACQEGRTTLDDADGLYRALSGMYLGSPVFLLDGTSAAALLAERLGGIQSDLRSLGVAGFSSQAPLATDPLDDTYRNSMVREPVSGIGILHGEGWGNRYELGDIEITGDLRLLNLHLTNEETGSDRLRFVLGAGGLVRLGTGKADHTAEFNDFGTVSGQMDYEARGFADLQLFGILGVMGSYHKGWRSSGSGTPGWLFAEIPLPTGSVPVEWEPGGYSRLTLAPRVRLVPGLSVFGEYGSFTRSGDVYTTSFTEAPVVVGGVGHPIPDLGFLGAESKSEQRTAAVGLIYSTLPADAEGGAWLPILVRARFEKVFDGSGGRTARFRRFTAEMRLFIGLWGD
jgi:hypothetical protein